MGVGGVTSDNLFDPNEQVLFDFYEANRDRYSRVLDIGANIGVHTILMARWGWKVRAFEPDPIHFVRLHQNVASHGVDAELVEAAVSDRDGLATFVRVMNNTTASHLAGARGAYGPLKQVGVRTVDCRPLFRSADFAKIDCEGHEAALVCAMSPEEWAAISLEAMLEVGSEGNAHQIFSHLIGMVPMWAQKIGWRRVGRLEDMPTHHTEGSLFIGTDPPFPGGPR